MMDEMMESHDDRLVRKGQEIMMSKIFVDDKLWRFRKNRSTL